MSIRPGRVHLPLIGMQVERRFVTPPPPLRRYVDRIWSWTAGPDADLPVALPGTGAELFLHTAAPFTAVDPHGRRTRLATGHVLCPRNRPVVLTSDGPVGFVAVRFRVGALRHFTQVPLPDVHDQLVPGDEVFGPEARTLPERLAAFPDDAVGFRSRASLVARWLLTTLERHGTARRPREQLVDAAASRLYYRAGHESVAQTARALAVSPRQLTRLVGGAVGMTPKRLQRLARFHHVTRRLLVERRTDLLRVACDGGYYDQAHFIHEVTALTGLTPRTLFTPAVYRSHFYNPRLPDRESIDGSPATWPDPRRRRRTWTAIPTTTRPAR